MHPGWAVALYLTGLSGLLSLGIMGPAMRQHADMWAQEASKLWTSHAGAWMVPSRNVLAVWGCAYGPGLISAGGVCAGPSVAVGPAPGIILGHDESGGVFGGTGIVGNGSGVSLGAPGPTQFGGVHRAGLRSVGIQVGGRELLSAGHVWSVPVQPAFGSAADECAVGSWCTGPGGDFLASAGGVYRKASDARLKQVLRHLGPCSAGVPLPRPVWYTWRQSVAPGAPRPQAGFLAQEASPGHSSLRLGDLVTRALLLMRRVRPCGPSSPSSPAGESASKWQ